jgi:hemoglobin-like flavoprotein
MQAEEIALVRQSWAKVNEGAEQAAALFYKRLFGVYPDLQPLFKGEMDEQGTKLMRMIGKAVDALDDVEPPERVIRMMGARHSGYGVRDEDYAKFGDALMWTLEQGLGDAFSPATRAAWASVYDDLAGLMRQGAGM